jgi:IS605 OrfB family transposase
MHNSHATRSLDSNKTWKNRTNKSNNKANIKITRKNQFSNTLARAARVNKAKTSRKLRRLYRNRQRRFKHAVNAMIKQIVEDAHQLGVSKIVLGKLRGIRGDNGKANTMINNFWSFNYILRRFREKAEEYGIKIVEVSEYKTSSKCPRCNSENNMQSGRLFKCLSCGLEAHRDAVGVLNIGSRQAENINGVVAYPLLLRWKGMRWEPKRAVNNQPMNTLETRISRLQSWRAST